MRMSLPRLLLIDIPFSIDRAQRHRMSLRFMLRAHFCIARINICHSSYVIGTFVIPLDNTNLRQNAHAWHRGYVVKSRDTLAVHQYTIRRIFAAFFFSSHACFCRAEADLHGSPSMSPSGESSRYQRERHRDGTGNDHIHCFLVENLRRFV
jgi:hypothetical protein